MTELGNVYMKGFTGGFDAGFKAGYDRGVDNKKSVTEDYESLLHTIEECIVAASHVLRGTYSLETVDEVTPENITEAELSTRPALQAVADLRKALLQ